MPLAIQLNKTSEAKKRSLETPEDDKNNKRKSMRRTNVQSRTEKFPENVLFDCGDELNKQALHSVTTFSVDCRVRKIATETNDTTILAKLSQGDMITIEAHYHTKCLISYYSKSRTKNEDHQRNPNAVIYGVALAEIFAFVEEQRIEPEITVFKLADLIKMYSNHLEDIGLETGNRINSTHFKERLLSFCLNLVAYKSGHDIFIFFPEHVGTILQNVYTEDSDDEGTYLTKTANIRREILNSTVSFEGQFDENCQATSVPKALVTLLSMIMNGSQLTLENHHDNVYNQQACLSVAQLLVLIHINVVEN